MKRVITCVLLALILTGCASTFSQQRELSRPMVALGMSKLEQNDIRGALIELTRALQANPKDPEVHYGLGLVYWKSGNFEKAMEHVDKAVEYGDRLGLERPGLKSEAHNLRGIILYGEGKSEAAIESFNRSLEGELYRTPEYSLHNLASIYLDRGDHEKALSYAQRALQSNQNYAPAWELLAKIMIQQGNHSGALEALNYALNEYPGYTEAHWEIAMLYIKMGNMAKAKHHLEEVMRLDPMGLFGALAEEKLRELGMM
ncbi:MAG TPA: tetratricopeptide repeat protein [Deltaproteobacteria bacterium]|nr:tetratricopeptide repeat protein [Deltaproteobacteria bacterium]